MHAAAAAAAAAALVAVSALVSKPIHIRFELTYVCTYPDTFRPTTYMLVC